MQTITLDRKKYVLVPMAEYQKLAAGRKMPPLPKADARGSRSAVAFADAAIARNIVKAREAAGLTQKQLAELAGIRAEVLNRAERGVTVPSVRTLAKIERGLQRAKKPA